MAGIAWSDSTHSPSLAAGAIQGTKKRRDAHGGFSNVFFGSDGTMTSAPTQARIVVEQRNLGDCLAAHPVDPSLRRAEYRIKIIVYHQKNYIYDD